MRSSTSPHSPHDHQPQPQREECGPIYRYLLLLNKIKNILKLRPVHWVRSDTTLVEQEVKTVMVTLRSSQVESCTAVVVSSRHVHSLQVHPRQGRHVPRHRGEEEGHHARPGVLEYVPAGVELVRLDHRIDLVKLMEVKERDQFLIRDRLEG